MNTITRLQLENRLRRERPNNDDRSSGYALINVLSPERYNDEHIPGSLNIPLGREAEFERRFDRSKEIIIYGSSYEGPSAGIVYQELSQRGFSHVIEFQGGMEEWHKAGNELQAGKNTVHEMPIA